MPLGRRRLQVDDAADLDAQAAGYWNSDRNIKTACQVVQVVDPNSKPCLGATVSAAGVDGIVSTGVVDSFGEACFDGPADVVRVSRACSSCATSALCVRAVL